MTSTPPTPPLPSMDNVDEPEQLNGFMRNGTSGEIVTEASDFDDIPLRNRFTGRNVEGNETPQAYPNVL